MTHDSQSLPILPRGIFHNFMSNHEASISEQSTYKCIKRRLHRRCIWLLSWLPFLPASEPAILAIINSLHSDIASQAWAASIRITWSNDCLNAPSAIEAITHIGRPSRGFCEIQEPGKQAPKGKWESVACPAVQHDMPHSGHDSFAIWRARAAGKHAKSLLT